MEQYLKVAFCSGGKDSIYTTIHQLMNDYLDEIIFCDTGWEFELMEEYILLFKEWVNINFPNVKFTLLNWGKSRTIFNKWCFGKLKKSKFPERIGRIRGLPLSVKKSYCTRELKVYPPARYLKENYPNHKIIKYIGYAIDERQKDRQELILDYRKGIIHDNQHFPLVDLEMTEEDCQNELIKLGFYNPLYNYFDRTACFMCPKQSIKSFYKIWKYFPTEWEKIVKIEAECREVKALNCEIKHKYPVKVLVEKFKNKYDKNPKYSEIKNISLGFELEKIKNSNLDLNKISIEMPGIP